MINTYRTDFEIIRNHLVELDIDGIITIIVFNKMEVIKLECAELNENIWIRKEPISDCSERGNEVSAIIESGTFFKIGRLCLL